MTSAVGQITATAQESIGFTDAARRTAAAAGEASVPAPRIDGYRVEGFLGAGGMGSVWRCRQLGTGRDVALKVMHAGGFFSDRARARFAREVELAARLQHPNIARVYDAGLHQGVYYYTMELVPGVPLDRYARDAGLRPRQVLALVRAVCEAVQHAHGRGIIHRDLKPGNILVTPEDGRPHVLDFGLARATALEAAEAQITVSGEWAGTPAYMSPEQAAGRSDELDVRSDVYSLGVVLYLLLTGVMPHDTSGSAGEVRSRVLTQEVRPPRRAGRAIDRELEAILLKALDREPRHRYSTAQALAEDIGRYLSGEPVRARRATPGYLLRKRLLKHRRRLLSLAAGLALVAATGAGVGVGVGRAHSRAQSQVPGQQPAAASVARSAPLNPPAPATKPATPPASEPDAEVPEALQDSAVSRAAKKAARELEWSLFAPNPVTGL